VVLARVGGVEIQGALLVALAEAELGAVGRRVARQRRIWHEQANVVRRASERVIVRRAGRRGVQRLGAAVGVQPTASVRRRP